LSALLAAPPLHETSIQLNVRVPMRDGVHLATNIFRPEIPGHIPTILLRTPYGKSNQITSLYRTFIEHGYAVVVQDVRGRYASEGNFEPLIQESFDGSDTLNWIAAQPWSDGKVGMTGGSYLGITQWKAAWLNNPHLKAIFPVVSGDDDYRDRFYSTGGALKWGNRLLWTSENVRAEGFQPPDFKQFVWTVPLRQADIAISGERVKFLQNAWNHPTYDAYWKAISTREHLKDISVPVYAVGGWFDNFVQSDLDAFQTLRKKNGVNHILIGPWPHDMSSRITTMDFGPTAAVPLRRIQIAWFDQWLKDNDVPQTSEPPVRIFVMGINQWRSEYQWPLARAHAAKYFLTSDGHANSVFGNGGLDGRVPGRKAPTDHYVYDPNKPVPTRGGSVCCNPAIFPWGPMDQHSVETRPDVLVYSTPILEEDVEVTGNISLTLFIESTAPDTDFTAKLVDVYPDGRAMNLTDGILRARYRDSIEKSKLLIPGKPVKVTIDAGVTSNVFRRGHRIRLEVSSSNFPHFDRNPNTGAPIADEKKMLKATQTIYHDRQHASYLTLPLIPAEPAAHATGLTSTEPARYVPKRVSPISVR
jgi:putative CocE/NonD family hydrolase